MTEKKAPAKKAKAKKKEGKKEAPKTIKHWNGESWTIRTIN